jgi:predicted  nucleic acid-binding Zn-ribbon protein
MKCTNCEIFFPESAKFCMECGTKLMAPVLETKIPERFLSVISDFEKLTGNQLTTELRVQFIQFPAVGRLSMNSSERRMAAGRNVRVLKSDGKYELNLENWSDAMYQIENPRSQQGVRVWTTSGGTKYHKTQDCRALSEGQSFARWKGKDTYKPEFVLLRDAAWISYRLPCEVCKPPKWEK